MGAKQTKIEGTYLSDTSTLSADNSQITNENTEALGNEKNTDVQDPRSPNICRTPISIFSASYQFSEDGRNSKVNQPESAVYQLRKRFFKGFSYNMNDPRSPGYQFNRTPISFDDSQDKILDLDDTFADLFAETQTFAPIQEQQKLDQDLETKLVEITEAEEAKEESGEVIEKVIEDFECRIENITTEEVTQTPTTMEPQPLTPKILRDEIDPRSPTIGVDRTPIIFNDDEDESQESVLLESILATLSLNMSDGSICSIGASNQKENCPQRQRGDANKTDRQGQLFRKITHRRMRRTRANEKIPLTPRRTPKDPQMSAQRVLEDCENAVPNLSMGRKLILKQKVKCDNNIKRTPLSCIKNNGNLHSRSIEKSTNSRKMRLEHDKDDSFTNMIVKSNCDM